MDEYTIHDLIDPAVREILEEAEIFKRKDTIHLVQKHLSAESKGMIDIIHTLMCEEDDCLYYREEMLELPWLEPAHIEYTKITVALMNTVGFNPGTFRANFVQYLKVIQEIVGPGTMHEMIKQLYFNKTETLAACKLIQPEEIE